MISLKKKLLKHRLHRSVDRSRPDANVNSSGFYTLETLEPRLLFSADLARLKPTEALTAYAHLSQDSYPVAIHSIQAANDADRSAVASEQQSGQVSRELVIIDAGIDDHEWLESQLSTLEGKEVEIVVLSAESNGLKQISRALENTRRVDAVHLLAHGADAELQLGDTKLDFNTLMMSAEEVQSWSAYLASDAHFLIYGCDDVAATATGQAYVNLFRRLTGADMAASTNVTGHDGYCLLEVMTGDSETTVLAESVSLEDF